jgi:hypothetical protein
MWISRQGGIGFLLRLFQGTTNQERQREIWICTGFTWWHLERPVPGVTLIFGFFGEA